MPQVAGLVLAPVLCAAGCGVANEPGRPVAPAVSAPPPTLSSTGASQEPSGGSAGAAEDTQIRLARAMLAAVAVGGRGPKTGYERTATFGEAWLDIDNNGCDTRNDILRRDLRGVRIRGTCEVVAGVLDDPYTGADIDFAADHAAVQIDHVVPLGLAWQLGAAQWGQDKRLRFANDPANLLAVDASSNMQKRDSGPDSWLPHDKSYRCTYVIHFTRVVSGYGLRMTAPMRTAVSTQIDRCTAIQGSPATLPLLPSGSSAPATRPATAQPSRTTTEPYYASCAEARAAGVTPLRAGGPGYRSGLDRDGDGLACE